MKKLYTLFLIGFLPFIAQAQSQCGVFVIPSTSCDTATCTGFASASGFGTPPFNYSWMPGNLIGANQNSLCVGTYTVTMTDSLGCVATQSVSILPSNLAAVVFNVVPASCANCCDGSATGMGTGGASPYTYIWMPGAFTTASAVGLCPGTYTFCVTDMNGCLTCTSTVVNFTTGLSSPDQQDFQVLPGNNPDQFLISNASTPSQNVSIRLVNALGQTVELRTVDLDTSSSTEFDLSTQAAGIYFILIESGGQKYTLKWVKS
jgi:Secretion system C-terminal sorting domain